jgi:hypothetical protein
MRIFLHQIHQFMLYFRRWNGHQSVLYFILLICKMDVYAFESNNLPTHVLHS